MMLRLIAAFLFTAAGSLCGMISSVKLSERKEICSEVSLLFRETGFMIRHQGRSVYEIAAALKRDKILRSLTFLQELPESIGSGGFRRKWASAVSGQKNIPSDVRKLLLEAGEMLGRSDIDGQLTELDVLAEKASLAEREMSGECSRKSKLFRSVGLLAGMMLGLMIV